MGKKSRRSNRKGRSSGHGSNTSMILRRIIQIKKEAAESYENFLYSKALHKIQEGLKMIQQYQDGMLKNTGSIDSSEVFEVKAEFCQALMMVQYNSCRLDKVVQIYNDIQISPENEKQVLLSFKCKLHGRLAMLRLDGSKENKDKVVSLIETRISEEMTDFVEVAMALEAVMILRNMKEYDAAIALGEKLERLTENGESPTSDNSILVIFENTLTHLERYRVEYHSQTGKDFCKYFLVRVLKTLNKFFGVSRKSVFCKRDEYFMIIAQKHYLCHQIDDKELSSKLYSSAIDYVERYLEKVWHFQKHYHTCQQVGTATDVQLVCSGCRVARYCSLDHQRLTWKKGAIQGMRIGHEILCPLMKAYRKWKLVKKKDSERSTKLRGRLDRECLYFLYHGLGLKDKCFREEDMQKYFSS